MAIKLTSLQNLLVEQLKDVYSAENQVLEALPRMSEAATSPKLKEAFESHLKETRTHIARIEKVFQNLDFKPSGHKCEGMAGLLKEGEEIIKDKDAILEVRDVALIAAAKRVEHYEIAAY